MERRVEKVERASAVKGREIGGRLYLGESREQGTTCFGVWRVSHLHHSDGSGYIRVLDPDMKAAAALVYPSAKSFDYVEHLLAGLDSVTYYGTIRR